MLAFILLSLKLSSGIACHLSVTDIRLEGLPGHIVQHTEQPVDETQHGMA